MNIAIIDADLISRKKHRFPNLVCMKLSSYYKERGDSVVLLMEYERIYEYDRVFVSKVFTDTQVPDWVLEDVRVEYGGTGFFYDKAPDLPYEIEHHMPDYHLYDDYVNEQIQMGMKRTDFKFYLDYSIGYMTRGCFRKCSFCVNKKYDKVFKNSPLAEFYDESRPKICLLDDNFFGATHWKDMMLELNATGKPFVFKQGLDERLLTDEKCELLCKAKYDGDIIFAFDNVDDYSTIEKKLQMLRRHSQKIFKFYVLTAFDRDDKWDDRFWRKDIEDVFVRIELLMQYKCIPYIMRFEKYNASPFRGMYITIARWCNQPSFFKKKSFREFCYASAEHGTKSSVRYMNEFEAIYPDIAKRFFDMKYEDFNGIPEKEQ